MKQIIKLSLFLAIVSALSAALLTAVYEKTHPIIIAYSEEKEKEQLRSIYHNGETFENYSKDINQYDLIEKCYEVKKDGQIQGYVYKISTPGYGGNIVYLVSLNQKGQYNGYETIDVSTETSGFGSRVGTDEMKEKIVGQDIGSEIDTLSGATISSTAVIKGINQATSHYQHSIKKGAS